MRISWSHKIACFRVILSVAGLALLLALTTSGGQGAPLAADPVITNSFANYWGDLTIGGSPAAAGTLVEAYDPRGDQCGKFVVTARGLFGYMRVYGEDTSSAPTIPGMKSGETVTFKVNGSAATTNPSSIIWANNPSPVRVNLAAGSEAAVTPVATAVPTETRTSQPIPTNVIVPVDTVTPIPSPVTAQPPASTSTMTPWPSPQPTSAPNFAPTATPNPTVAIATAASSPLLSPTPGQPSNPSTGSSPVSGGHYFSETGFQVSRPAAWDYFAKRGSVNTFGYPVSREFTLFGFPVQFFQRGILQMMPDGSVARMNILDEGLMPYTRINGSTFPALDPLVIAAAPAASDSDYGTKVVSYIQSFVPDVWEGMPVGFMRAFNSTVRYEDAFPNGDGDPALVPFLNLEIWGLPTSRPMRDPNNSNFVYLRFQRGIMHFDASTGVTQGLLLADYLKSIITGQNLPPDLEEQARGSRLYRQFDPSAPGGVSRPGQLPGTDLSGAFDRSQ